MDQRWAGDNGDTQRPSTGGGTVGRNGLGRGTGVPYQSQSERDGVEAGADGVAATSALISITPSCVGVGASVHLHGSGFGLTPSDNTVTFGGATAVVTEASLLEHAVAGHLTGRHVMGVYPLLEDETCWLLAVDFDKATWIEDVSAFVETCRGVGLPSAVERSRSGHGARR